jgi:hypothetical protein
MKNLLAILLAVVLVGCETKAEPTVTGPWKKLGEVSNGAGTGTVFWTVNTETGDRVYVLVGGHVGGVYVLPGKTPAESPNR